MTVVQSLTRDQVERAERHAWAEQGGRKYFYDGIEFWVEGPLSRRQVPRSETPSDGWWHREGCNCPLCRARG